MLQLWELGHMKRNCTKKTTNEPEISFAAGPSRAGWLLDSGASSHMSPSRADFHEMRPVAAGVKVTVADGAKLQATGVGVVKSKLQSGRIVSVCDVLYVPNSIVGCYRYRSWR